MVQLLDAESKRHREAKNSVAVYCIVFLVSGPSLLYSVRLTNYDTPTVTTLVYQVRHNNCQGQVHASKAQAPLTRSLKILVNLYSTFYTIVEIL